MFVGRWLIAYFIKNATEQEQTLHDTTHLKGKIPKRDSKSLFGAPLIIKLDCDF